MVSKYTTGFLLGMMFEYTLRVQVEAIVIILMILFVIKIILERKK